MYLAGILALLKPSFDARHAIYVSTRKTTELIHPKNSKKKKKKKKTPKNKKKKKKKKKITTSLAYI